MPPPATRQCAVTSFPTEIGLFLVSESNLFPSVHSHFVSISVRAIHCSAHVNQDDPSMESTMKVSFWSANSDQPVHEAIVSVPLEWSPRIFLAAIRLTVTQRNNVCLYKVTDTPPGYCRINEVHWLYENITATTRSILEEQHAFVFIFGGDS